MSIPVNSIIKTIEDVSVIDHQEVGNIFVKRISITIFIKDGAR
jgi:hypothetical protein